jgi:hypothetical protein
MLTFQFINKSYRLFSTKYYRVLVTKSWYKTVHRSGSGSAFFGARIRIWVFSKVGSGSGPKSSGSAMTETN